MTRMTTRRRLTGILAALGIAFGIGVLAAPAAQAAPLPSGDFKMDIGDGTQCVTADILSGDTYASTCSALNLAQNFFYDATNYQIQVLGGLFCLSAGSTVGDPITVESCSATDPLQTWDVVGIGTAGQVVSSRAPVTIPPQYDGVAMAFDPAPLSTRFAFFSTYYSIADDPDDLADTVFAVFRNLLNQPI